MRRYALRDDQWERIKDLLPGREGHVGVTAKDNRLFVEAVLYRYRAGIPWRDLPERFGDWNKVHTRFSRWAKRGVWAKLFQHLAGEADNEYAMIDSTIVRAHQHASGAEGGSQAQAIGRSRGGLSSKLHLAVRGLGCPVRFVLTAGQVGDVTEAGRMLEGLAAEVVIADTAHDADHVPDAVATKGAEAVIPSNPARARRLPLDEHLYKERHVVECCIGKLKQFRRVATRYEKTARNYLAVVTIAAIVLWLR